MRSLFLLPLLIGCAAPTATPTETFEHLWFEFDAMYGPFEQRNVDWDAGWDEWRPLVHDEMDDEALFNAMTGLLTPLDDGHVKLQAPGRETWQGNVNYRERIAFDTFDLDVVRDHYLTDDQEGEWGQYTWGKVDGDLAYVSLPWIDDNCFVIDDIAERYPNARGLILDLRHNGGGDFTYAFAGLGRLTDTERYVFRSRTRNAPERGSFDAWTRWSMAPRGAHVDWPVVVLTDRFTISAGERAVMALKTLPQVVVVGEATNGAQATLIGRELPNAWTFALPVQEVEFHDGSVFEGPGVPVDIEVLNDPADLEQGRDEMLETAIALLGQT